MYTPFNLVDMKSLFLLFSGIVIGLWTSWPGIVIPNNWKCFKDMIDKSAKRQFSLKAALAISPNYLLKGNSFNKVSQIRVVNDASFS